MELERNHCHCLILYIGMIKWNVITAFFFLLILSTGFIQITWQASKTISVLENELPLEMIDLNSLSTNSPNFKPIILKLRTSAIPSNIPVDCAEMCYSGNAFPSTLWSKEALFSVDPQWYKHWALAHGSGPKGKDKTSLRSTFLFCIIIIICANKSLWYFKGLILSLTEILKTLTRSLNVLSFYFFTGL